MDTYTSPTPLLTMQASTCALPPVLWATLARRSSSVSTVRQRNVWQQPPKYSGVWCNAVWAQSADFYSSTVSCLDIQSRSNKELMCFCFLFLIYSCAKNNGREWSRQHGEGGCRGRGRSCSPMWGPRESFPTGHMEKKWAPHPSRHSWVRGSSSVRLFNHTSLATLLACN